MTDIAAPVGARPLRWFQGVPRYAWVVLGFAALGWMLDCTDQHLFNLVRPPSVTELLTGHVPAASLDATAKEVGSQLTAVFLIGWAAGGFLFGVVGDRLGRTRTMMLTILTYAAFTGLNALVRNPWEYGLCRFLTAMGVGGEFAAGASLVAEVWPDRSRPMALGTLQALSSVGNIAAAGITYVLAGYSWRWVYVVGAAPAIVVIFIYFFIKEPEKWHQAREAAAQGGPAQQIGSITALFANAELRRRTIGGVLLAMAGVGGVWGVGFFFADLVRYFMEPIVKSMPDIAALTGPAQAAAVKKVLTATASKAFFCQQIGAFIGMMGYATLSERIGRKPALAIAFSLAFVSVQAAFWGARTEWTAYAFAFPMGICALAPFAAYAVYFPELFPTRLRATGVGFCYNCARILAAAAPFTLGKFAAYFADPNDKAAGLRVAASIIAFIYVVGFIGLKFVPETKGQPLPE